MEEKEKQKEEVSFVVVGYKIVSGIFEVLFAIALAFFRRPIYRWYLQISTQELFEDPHDLLARTFQTIIPVVTQHRVYLIFLLSILGITKIIGAIAILKKKEWGLDLMVGLFVFLLPFDLYNLTMHPSLLKCVYLVINSLIVFYLIRFRARYYVKKIHHALRSRHHASRKG